MAATVAIFLLATPTALVSFPWSLDVRLPLAVADAAAVGAVVVAYRRPLVATGLGLLPFAFVLAGGSFVWGWLLGLLGVVAVAAARRWLAALPAFAAAVVVAGVYCGGGHPAVLPIGLVTSGGGPGGYGEVTFALYVAWFAVAYAVAALGGAVPRLRVRQRETAVQERHAFEVEHVASERARMARDLHDVVAHHVSLIAVRAESAPYQHPDLDPAAREVLAAIATDARTAIGELRHALTVLRRTDEAAPSADDLRPQPDADGVPDLLREAEGAGQPVRATGGWRAVPATQGYVLYRAVQEGLTNARRHAPGATVVVVRTQEQGRVGFVMSNAVPGDAPPGPPGRGLLGMQERVAALGGTLHTGLDGARFVLSVDLPDGGRR